MNSTDLPSCINAKLTRYFEQLSGEEGRGVYKMMMNEVESITLQFILELTHNNQSEAAKILGISRATLKKKIALYQL
jgi:Fis family transcriptional regulator